MSRIGFDATPLLGSPTGIGRYVSALANRMAATDPTLSGLPSDTEFVATAFSKAPGSALRAVVPEPILTHSRPVPAQLLHELWRRTERPQVQALSGKVDLFHGTNFVLPPVGRARGAVSIHDLAYLRYPETVSAASARYRELVPRSLSRAAVVFALTETMAADISAEYGIGEDRIVVTGSGVDSDWFDSIPLTTEQRRALELPEDYLVAVGTLEPRKNLHHLIEVHRRICTRDPETPWLVLAGPSGWGPDLGLRESDRVVLAGYLPVDLLRGLVAGARLLAYPSLYEGFGIPPLEALACGKPVVVSDLPTTREVLGDHAAFFDNSDADALENALIRTLAEPISNAAIAARKTQARRWTWDACADAILRGYAQVLAG